MSVSRFVQHWQEWQRGFSGINALQTPASGPAIALTCLMLAACGAFVVPTLDVGTGPCTVATGQRADAGIAIVYGSADSPSLRLVAPGDPSAQTTLVDQVGPSEPSWSCDGKRVAFVGGEYPRSNVYVASAGSEEPPRQLFPEGGEYLAIAWAT
ncbi:MAG: hypothetical protein DCC49_06575 [Acidobacteria bacterium]|nr:MAG: hypothetical protein DCC49_06575 [Acidobacteriota bacterium]